MQTLRYADPITVAQYPLPVAGPLDWRRDSEGVWGVELPLPDLEAGDLLTPSLSVLDRPGYRFQFILLAAEQPYPLRPVPSTIANRDDPDPSDARVRTLIDCYQVTDRLIAPWLRVRLETGPAPERYLLAVSVRPVEMTVTRPESLGAVHAPRPPARSQMLGNPRIARRTCSPVSTAMVIATHRPRVGLEPVIDACLDPVTGMYGLWPLAIRAASGYGLIGAVELLSGWPAVITCVQRGLPVVASIRYGDGTLPGAPQRATAGHLVVVHGVVGDQVLVNDPAAPHHGSVCRRYPVDAFGSAWFRHRGAAYILTP